MITALIAVRLPSVFARDATVMREGDGKAKYKPLIVRTKELGRRLSEAVVRLVEASCPQPVNAAQ